MYERLAAKFPSSRGLGLRAEPSDAWSKANGFCAEIDGISSIHFGVCSCAYQSCSHPSSEIGLVLKDTAPFFQTPLTCTHALNPATSDFAASSVGRIPPHIHIRPPFEIAIAVVVE